MDDCGGVYIQFPHESSSGNKVLLRGSKENVVRAEQQLLDQVEKIQQTKLVAAVSQKVDFTVSNNKFISIDR